MKYLMHIYDHAEVYTVILGWLVIPLGYYSCYLFFSKHFGIFKTPAQSASRVMKAVQTRAKADGAN